MQHCLTSCLTQSAPYGLMRLLSWSGTQYSAWFLQKIGEPLEHHRDSCGAADGITSLKVWSICRQLQRPCRNHITAQMELVESTGQNSLHFL